MQNLIQKHESIANGYRHVESLYKQLSNLHQSRNTGLCELTMKINKPFISRTRNRISRMLILIEHLNDNH
jgi:hypothetical protein